MTYDLRGDVSAAVMRAASEGLQRVGAPDRTRVLFTDAFSEDVARFTGNASYNADRGAGVVGARTVGAAYGTSIIFVNAAETRRREPAEVERLLAHEGGHALLNARGEDLQGLRHLVSSNWQWEMLCVGALALDEARIETRLRALGYPATGTATLEHLEDALYVLNCDVVWALVDPDSGVRELAQRIVVAQDHITKLLAYLAPYSGAAGAASPWELPEAGKRHWGDYVSGVWERRRALYALCPDASEPLARAELGGLYKAALAVEVEQLAALGFERSGGDDDEMFLRVASDERCNERVSAAVKESDARM